MNIRVIHQQTKRTMTGHLGTNDKGSPFELDRPIVVIHFGNMIGCREFSYNHGYGVALANSKEAPIRDWRIDAADLEAIREMAREEGKKVSPCGKSPGRPRQPRKGPAPHPKQLSFGEKE